jgi:hypothetical protein
MTVDTRLAVNVETAPVWIVSATVTMVMAERVAICPTTTSASTGPVTYLPIAQTPWEAIFAPVVRDMPEMVTYVLISMSVPTPPWPHDAWPTPSAAIYQPTLSASVALDLRAMARSNVEVRLLCLKYTYICSNYVGVTLASLEKQIKEVVRREYKCNCRWYFMQLYYKVALGGKARRTRKKCRVCRV